MSDTPETSIVVRTFNEEKHLPKLLEGLEGQTYRDYELVVVDSGSYDRTREIARRPADKLLRIRSQDFTYGYSLNVGVEASEGRYIVIVSAHTKPLDDSWLERLVTPLRDAETAMAYGKQIAWETSKFSDTMDFRRTFGPVRKVMRAPHFYANNANSAIRKDLWRIHRFDEALPGLEDIEWAKYWMQKGYQVVYEPEAALQHSHEESWPQVRRRFYREAVAAKMLQVSDWRGIPSEILSDGRRLVSDLYHASLEDNVWRRAPEIFMFRMNKAIGTTSGFLNGAAAADPAAKEAMYFDRICQAVVVRGAGQAALEEIEVPAVKPGEVLVRVAYVGVCPIDVEILDGTHSYYQKGIAKYPIVPGHEFSGRVVATGVKVNQFEEGDRVVGAYVQGCGRCAECRRGAEIGCGERVEMGVFGRDGAYSEYFAVSSDFVTKVPDDVDLRSACLSETLAVVLKGLRRFWRALPPTTEARRCLVVGAGPQGHFCARVLALQGHDVTVYDQNPDRLRYFAGSPISVTDSLEQLGAFEVLVQLTGDSHVLETMLLASPPGATILLLDVPSTHQRIAFENIVSYDKTVVGSVGSSLADMEEALALLPKLELNPYFQNVLAFVNFRDAWDNVRENEHLKTLLEVDAE